MVFPFPNLHNFLYPWSLVMCIYFINSLFIIKHFKFSFHVSKTHLTFVYLLLRGPNGRFRDISLFIVERPEIDGYSFWYGILVEWTRSTMIGENSIVYVLSNLLDFMILFSCFVFNVIQNYLLLIVTCHWRSLCAIRMSTTSISWLLQAITPFTKLMKSSILCLCKLTYIINKIKIISR